MSRKITYVRLFEYARQLNKYFTCMKLKLVAGVQIKFFYRISWFKRSLKLKIEFRYINLKLIWEEYGVSNILSNFRILFYELWIMIPSNCFVYLQSIAESNFLKIKLIKLIYTTLPKYIEIFQLLIQLFSINRNKQTTLLLILLYIFLNKQLNCLVKIFKWAIS